MSLMGYGTAAHPRPVHSWLPPSARGPSSLLAFHGMGWELWWDAAWPPPTQGWGTWTGNGTTPLLRGSHQEQGHKK